MFRLRAYLSRRSRAAADGGRSYRTRSPDDSQHDLGGKCRPPVAGARVVSANSAQLEWYGKPVQSLPNT
jgi:hypothetical protein